MNIQSHQLKISIFAIIDRIMVQILNPIYDTSFKYLMSDEKVARILLSALLKRNVTSLALASQEYVDTIKGRKTGRDYTVYRLDFKATVETDVRDAAGNVVGKGEETVLIEVQKVWLQTELMRFRKYLGGQYSDPNNVKGDGKTPRHIVAIYILGHDIPNMTEAISYGYGSRLVNYDGHPVEMVGKSDFVESLTHDIVIVQVPRLPSKPGNAAERLLDIFDQRNQKSDDPCVLNLPDDLSEMSVEKKAVVSKLREGLLDDEMRRKMSVEDEILWEFDYRDKLIEEKEAEAARYKAEAEKSKVEVERSRAEAEKSKAEAEKNKESVRLAVLEFKKLGLSAEQIAPVVKLGVEDVKEMME